MGAEHGVSGLLARYRAVACSVELWPARTPEQERRLDETVAVLREHPPAFVSVTYGALGSSRAQSLELIERVRAEGHPVLAHLAVAGHTTAELVELVGAVRRLGASGVLALRGDPPLDRPDVTVELADRHAMELVEVAKAEGGLEVAVALHPAGHPDSRDAEEDWDHQATKLQRADFGITQFYFAHTELARLLGALRERGVRKPVVPGLLVPRSLRQLERMGEMANVAVPAALAVGLAGEDPAGWAQAFVVELARTALRDGAPGVHLFSMNQPEVTARLLGQIGEIGGAAALVS